MTPTAYDTADLLAETCRRRWAQQFDSHAPDCVLCGPPESPQRHPQAPLSDETGGKATTPPTDEINPSAGDCDHSSEPIIACWKCRAPMPNWPAPRPGTHESDLTHIDYLSGYMLPGQTLIASLSEFLDGQHWSLKHQETA